MKNFSEIPSPCDSCLYWQRRGSLEDTVSEEETRQKKRGWFDKVIRKFGTCGSIAYLNGVSIGFVQYAPAEFFPRVKEYHSGSPSMDSVFLACLYIPDEENRGKGLGTAMLKNVLDEFREKGFKAVETFARKGSQNNPSGPIELYLKQGFKTRRCSDDFPLMRLEL